MVFLLRCCCVNAVQLSRQLLLDEMAFSPKMLLCKGACYPNRPLLSFLVGGKADDLCLVPYQAIKHHAQLSWKVR